MRQVMPEQGYLSKLLVLHPLDHVQVMFVDQLRFRFFVLGGAYIHTALLTPEKRKWVFRYLVFRFSFVALNHDFVVGFIRRFYFYS